MWDVSFEEYCICYEDMIKYFEKLVKGIVFLNLSGFVDLNIGEVI